MTRKTWDEVKKERADSPDRRRGYERARRTIRLAMEIHELREKRGLSRRELAERLAGVRIATTHLHPRTARSSIAPKGRCRPPGCMTAVDAVRDSHPAAVDGDL